MRVFRQRQENSAPEVKTPSVLKEHIFRSHPLDMDSDSEASYTSSLDNQADHTTSPGTQIGQEPSTSAKSTASKVNQQVSSQRADFIASHTPTSLSKAHKMAGSMQSLAREAAMAAANRAGNVSRSITAAADIDMDQASSAAQQSDGTDLDFLTGRCQNFTSQQVWLLLSEKALQGAYMQAPKHRPADNLTIWASLDSIAMHICHGTCADTSLCYFMRQVCL
ncbi:hypothetical protein WJX77_009514 [Trebouxia sp. C0004]